MIIKRYLILIIFILIILSKAVYAEELADDFYIQELAFDEYEHPILIDDTVYVPAASTFSMLGLEYEEYDSSCRVTTYEDIYKFRINQRVYQHNDKYVMVRKPALKVNKECYIPINTLSKMLSMEVNYNESRNTIIFDAYTAACSNDSEQSQIIPQLFVDTSDCYTLNEIEDDIQDILDRYESLVDLEVIGASTEGRPIYSIRVGIQSDKKKPSLLFMGGIHAREDFTVMFDMKSLDTLLYSYFSGGMWDSYDVNNILEQLDIYFIPVLNPDGLNIAHNGIESSANYEYLKDVKNISDDAAWWKANANGVDLNANFDDGNWSIKFIKGLSSKVPASEGYKGSEPNSELETKAIQRYCREKLFTLAVSLHCSGELFYWADNDTHQAFEGYDTIVIKKLAEVTGYKKKGVSKDSATFGAGFENWFKKTFQRFGFCMELAPHPGKPFIQHPDEDFDELVWMAAKYTLPELSLQTISIYENMYDVYQWNVFLKTFYSEEKAIKYAKLWDHSKVIHNGETVFEQD